MSQLAADTFEIFNVPQTYTSEGNLEEIIPVNSEGRSSTENSTEIAQNMVVIIEPTEKYVVGVCAMECKSRSKPMRNILNVLVSLGNFTVEIFNEKMILEEEVSEWPVCDFLISFYSTGFPLNKSIAYAALRRPYVVNDLNFQTLLFDRRLVLDILTRIGVPSLPRVVLNRGPKTKFSSILGRLARRTGGNIEALTAISTAAQMLSHDTLVVDGLEIEKPFVEKPVNAEDHNIWVYFHSKDGGGCRKLFRKIENKSSEFFPDIWEIRQEGSYIYEKYVDVDHAEDVKVYAVGPNYALAETRKSPVIDGVVQRNHEGKEVRYMTALSPAEAEYSRLISTSFRQTVCGFDLLRAKGRSYIIDVNGWSFVKGNKEYYDTCADMLAQMFMRTVSRRNRRSLRGLNQGLPSQSGSVTAPELGTQWRLKAFFCVLRHADRTPKLKQKFEVGITGKHFKALLGPARVEVVFTTPGQLALVIAAARKTIQEKLESDDALVSTARLLALIDSRSEASTLAQKVQLKASWEKKNPSILKGLQVVVKWGGAFTHAGAHQAVDFGENLRKDLLLLNRRLLDDVRVYSASEERVLQTANVFLNTFLAASPPGMLAKSDATASERAAHIRLRPDLLDDAWAAKEPMDLAKNALKESSNNLDSPRPQLFTSEGEIRNLSQNSTLFSQNMLGVGSMAAFDNLENGRMIFDDLVNNVQHLRKRLQKNYSFYDGRYEEIQAGWCCGESPAMFFERWEKLLVNYIAQNQSSSPSLKVDGSDTINLSKVPEAHDSFKYDLLHNRQFLCAMFSEEDICLKSPRSLNLTLEDQRVTNGNNQIPPLLKQFYVNNRTLYDVVSPGEYGTTVEECQKIAISTCQALMAQLVADIREASAGLVPQTRLYFTKERHVQTLLNLVYLSGLPMRVGRSELGELDYLTQIAFEVYERRRSNATTATEPNEREFSLRVAFSPGARCSQLLDLDVEKHHALSPLPRRAITEHMPVNGAVALLGALIGESTK